MAFIVVQAGTSLYMVSDVGVPELLTLPSGVTLDATIQPRFTIMNKAVLMVNSPSKNLWIDGSGTVRLMSLDGPATAPTVAVGSNPGITGTIKVMYAFAIIDVDDNIIAMSPFSPVSAEVVLTNDSIDLSNLELSANTDVNARVVVRNLSNGEVFFEALLIDNNVDTTAELTVPDAELPILPTDVEAVNPPGTDGTDALELITEHKGHLFAKAREGSSSADIDDLLFSVNGEFSRFNLEDAFLAAPRGGDAFGITAFIKRRDELGVGRRRKLLKLIGDDVENFEMKDVLDGVGPAGQEGCCVLRDVAYFLSMEDGAWEWGPSGVRCISDNDSHPWFTTDRFFNRARFPYAKSRVNPIGPCWDIHLASLGSDVEDTWVSFNISNRKWLGPHTTSAFAQIASAGQVFDENQLVYALVGAEDGHLYRTLETLKTDNGEAIDFDIIGKYHGDGVNAKRNWLKPKVTVKRQASGTLLLIPVVGEIPEDGVAPTEQANISIDLTIGQHPLLRYGGVGRYYRPRFRCADVGVRAKLIGYELPHIDIGIRT